MSNRLTKVPKYVSYEAASAWHLSALHAIGVESMTMSSRLRTSHSNLGTLQDIENIINSTGKRRIAKFEMSIADPDVLSQKADERLAKAATAQTTNARDMNEDVTKMANFDMDAFSKDYPLVSKKDNRSEHIFARAEAYRGAWDLSERGGRDPRDRFGDGPAVERYVVLPMHTFSGIKWCYH